MRRILLVLLVAVLVVCNISAVCASDVTLYLDGTKITCDPPAMIVNSRTMIPLRAVFEKVGATVSWDDKTRTVGIVYKDTTLEMTIDSIVAKVNGLGIRLDSPAIIVKDRTMIPLRFISETIGAAVSWDDKTRTVHIESPEEVPPVIIEDLEFSKKDGYDLLTMTSSGKTAVRTMTLKEPNRMVFDIQNASLAVKNASHKGNEVTEVRYGDHTSFVRIVAENDELPRYIMTNASGYTELKLYGEKKNFDYIGMSDPMLIFSEGVKINSVSKEGNTLTFKSDKKLVDEKITIGDELIDTVTIKGTSITVKLKKSAEYTITNNTVVFSVKDQVKNDVVYDTGVIVLDAGHGGYDPGTLGYAEDGKTILANEKDMNLTITLLVYEMLKKRGVTVVLTRSDDTFIGLTERAKIANKTNAEYFVSIHNNSIPDPSYKGSMVLYNLGSTGGKKLANNILKSMTASAKTVNKGLRDGSNMAVIRNTAMPAVIVECGCLTNADELQNLMEYDFLYLLAEGITEGIIKTLTE